MKVNVQSLGVSWPEGARVLPYLGSFRYVRMPPQRVWFLRRFDLKTCWLFEHCINFANTLWSGNGYDFRGNYGSL